MQGSGSSHLSKTMAHRTQIMLVYSIRVSQGSVMMHFWCGEIFNGSFIPNFLDSVPVKDFENLLRIDKIIDRGWCNTFQGHSVDYNLDYNT